MGEFVRSYKFYGHGTIWDTKKNRPLCTFNNDGYLETSDPYVIKALIAQRVPFEDGRDTELQRAEYAIEILTDRVDILEQMNQTLKDRLAAYEEQHARPAKASKEMLLAELESYGLPVVFSLSTASMQSMLDEYKAIVENKVRESMRDD